MIKHHNIAIVAALLSLMGSQSLRGADDVLIADFEGADYAGWTVTGDAFGKGPAHGTLPNQQGVSGFLGHGLVNSFVNGDKSEGTLTSPPFQIERQYINFLIGGGNHPATTRINLLIDGKAVRTATGADDEHLDWHTWPVAALKGRSAQIQIIDQETGGWGHINVDQIVQSDTPKVTIAPLYQEALRPQFHFTADRNWLNGADGLVYFSGEYHLFFLHDPDHITDQKKSWGHAVSPDLVHWEQLPEAISPDARGEVYSGSAVVDWNNSAGFQTGNEPPLVAMFTAAGTPYTQCLAYSNDRGRSWMRYEHNPVIANISDKNRDPRVVWYQPLKQWAMVLFLHDSTFAFFSSPDLKTWTHLQDLDVPGCVVNPDFFPMKVEGTSSTEQWVLVTGDGRYLVGSFDGKRFTPEQKLQRGEYGNNWYAAQTYSDISPTDGRRIQIAWMKDGKYPGMPFNQQLTFPVELKLHATAEGMRLTRMPVREIELLHKDLESWSDIALHPGDDPLAKMTGDLYDISAEIDVGTAKEIAFNVRGQHITWSAQRQTLTCLGSAPLPLRNGRLMLRILVDKTSLETFAGEGEVSISDCFLPDPAQRSLGLSATGGDAKIVSVKVYKIQSAWAAGEAAP